MNTLEIEASEERPFSQNQGLLDQGWVGYSTHREANRRPCVLITLVALSSLSLVLSLAALSLSGSTRASLTALGLTGGRQGPSGGSDTAEPLPDRTSIAFGSCTSYDLRPQPIWTQGVIPAQPDAWVWLGDIAYMDKPLVDCAAVPHFPECSCTATFMRRPPEQCTAGDPVHARQRMSHQLSIQEYHAFLSFMCPGYEGTEVFPPRGTDPAMCPRPILGTYDDHDSGWNNGDARNPAKHEMKNIFLDGIGEDPASPRRSNAAGLQTHYTLRNNRIMAAGTSPGSSSSRAGPQQQQQGAEGHERDIEVILLDGRYFRETLPCSKRAAWCNLVSKAAKPGDPDAVWCQDFLVDGGPGPRGSCCTKDDEWDAWCTQAKPSHPHWQHLCDPTSSQFGQEQLILAPDNTTVLPHTPELWDRKEESILWRRLIEGGTSPVCEVLGYQQRRWLQDILASSPAPLKLIASGSVLAGSLGWSEPGTNSTCSGDDWECWPRAQTNLLHMAANASSGCMVFMVGDYHFSDLKVILPGQGHKYAQHLRTDRLRQPVYQIMSSGMTWSTAEERYRVCEQTYREDLVGLRPLGRCSYVHEPAFGLVSVDWKQQTVSLSIRNSTTGGVAYGLDGKRQEVEFSLRDCQLSNG